MEIQERIRHKADELFRRYGIRSVTMDEIATQLGMSKKTIYQYYTDKDQLVDAVAVDEIQFSQQCCMRDSATAENAIEEIFKVMEFVEVMFRNMNPSMLHDLEKYHPGGYRKFLEHKNKFLYEMVKRNIERGIREELYRPEIDVEIMARYRLESMMLAFNTELFPTSKFNFVKLQQEILEHFLYGLATLKGYKLILKYKQQRLNK
ncbi:MAG TPA: TetR/AcrR family transcriptional regulator [Chitinophagaceae bacterium]|nr:TetR/AcrR family transcriptional regulator [Chitinophagaceae bacterium]